MYPNFTHLKQNPDPSKLVGIDIETTAIDQITKEIDLIWSISWCYSNGDTKSVFWPDGISKEALGFELENCKSLALMSKQGTQAHLLSELYDILSCTAGYTPCFHNAQFDAKHLGQVLHLPYYHDTMIMAYCVIPPAVMGSTGDEDAMRFYSLKYLGDLGYCSAKLDFKSDWSTFSQEMLTYNQRDSKGCMELGRAFLPILMQDIKTFDAYLIDMCASYMCSSMERNGVLINADSLQALTLTYETELSRTVEKLTAMVPGVLSTKEYIYNRKKESIPFSKNGIYPTHQIHCYVPVCKRNSQYVYRKVEKFSPSKAHHVAVGLTALCELNPETAKKSKKTNKLLTSSNVLEQYSNHEFAELVLGYRKYSKLVSTYLKPFYLTSKDGRIHPSFLVTATRTGRLSSRGPNFQNIPRSEDLRRLIVAKKGYKIVCLDLSQIELRILAWYMAKLVPGVNGQYLWNIYEANGDVHEENRKRMGPSAERKDAKIGVFLWVYGGGPDKLAQQVHIPYQKAKLFLDNMIGNIPGLPSLKARVEADAKKYRLIRTLYGHKIIYPNIDSDNRSLRLQALRQYFNARIQGTQADIAKIIMWQCRKPCSAFYASMLMQVHDEFVFEVPEGNAPGFADALELIVNNRKFLPGMKVQGYPGIGDSWYEAKVDGERVEKEHKQK